jgi:hypothetical protein
MVSQVSKCEAPGAPEVWALDAQWSAIRRVRPMQKTARGMRKWESVRMAAVFWENVI